jgi:hypothetical protein
VTTARFPLGRLLATPGALRALDEADVGALAYIARHQCGDWGDVCADDARANDQALGDGTRLFSVYTLPTGVRVWIITEWDRSSTTILLPEDY